jgi:hypothetical protein
MAKIIDPDNLIRNTNIFFITASNASGSKTITLATASALTLDGVTIQAVYSKCKELWDTTEDLIKYPFPLIAITEKKFDLTNGWDWGNTLTKNLLRDGGWALKDANNNSLEEYMGLITLGTLFPSDQVYYQQTASAASVDVVYTGSVNSAVKIYGAAAWGNFDYRNYFKVFVREYQETYGQADLTSVGETSLTYQVYSFPLSDASDVKITHNDVTVSGSAPYTSISASFYTASFSRSIGGVYYWFDTLIQGAGATKEQIYEKVQYLLRQNTNINSVSGTFLADGTISKTADGMLNFVGDTLYTAQGVYIDNISNTDINFYVFRDTGSNQRTFPYVAAGTINFSDTLKNDPSSSYKMFFTSTPSSSYGSASALIVNDKDGNPITGSASGSSFVTFTFDYDFNSQGSRTSGSDAPVTIVAIGLSTAQYISTVGTIARSNANVFTLVSALERNYNNP